MHLHLHHRYPSLHHLSVQQPLATPTTLIYSLPPHEQVPAQFNLTPDDRRRLATIQHPQRARSMVRSRYLMQRLGVRPVPRPSGYLHTHPPLCLSHKHHWVLCGELHATSAQGSHHTTLGIDLETTQLRLPFAKWLLRRYAPHLTATTKLPLHLLAALIFSAKEALYKGWSRYGIERLSSYCQPNYVRVTPGTDRHPPTYATSFTYQPPPAISRHHGPSYRSGLIKQMILTDHAHPYVLSIYTGCAILTELTKATSDDAHML